MKAKIFFLVGFISFFLFIPSVNAASFSMSSSKKEVNPNGTFTISVGGDCIGRVNLSVSNGTLSTNSIWVEQGYMTVNVTAGASGTVTITATPVTGFSDPDANLYNPGSRTVTVSISSNTSSSGNTTKPSTPSTTKKKSGDTNLASLTISSGKLSPSFDANVTEYSVNLKGDTTNITIDAKASDSKAKINGLGNAKLHPGNNKIEIIVTAENGTKKTYLIKAYVDETPEVYLDYKNNKIGIVRNYDGITIPNEFNANEYTVDEKNITIFSKESLNIIYGIDENNERSFYLFDKDKKEIISKFSPLTINNKTIYTVDTESSITNGTLDKVTINDEVVNCYTFDNEENYCLLNTINTNGELVAYLYEKRENNMVLYPTFLSKCESKEDDKNGILYIFSGLTFLLLGITLYLFYKMKTGDSNEKSK